MAVIALAAAGSFVRSPPCPASPDAGASLDRSFVYESWRTHTTSAGLPNDAIRAVRVSERGVWVGTEGGLALRTGDGWTSWTADDGLPWPDVSAIDLDALTGDVWLGTWGGGLVRFTGGRFDVFDQLNSGLSGNLVFAVTVADGRVWAATNGGLSVLDIDTGTWQLHLARRADAPETAVTSLAIVDGRVHAAAWCEGLLRLDPHGSTWSRVASAHVPGTTTVAVASTVGGLWWATQDALLCRGPGGEWTAVPIPDRLAPGRHVRCIAAMDDAVAALGTDRGLEVLVDGSTGTWIRYAPLEDGATAGVTLDRDGEIVDTIGLASGIPDRRVRCIAFDGGDIWIGTPSGLARGSGRRPWTAHAQAPVDTETRRAPAPRPASSPGGARTDRGPVVSIGILRPGNRVITVPGSDAPGAPRPGGMDRMAAMLAVEQANARGGFRGEIPFALATGPQGSFDGWGWTTPEDDFPALARRDDVVGIVGSIGPGARSMTAVARETGLPVVNVSTTTPTIDEIVNPWIFRARGNEGRRQRLVLDHVLAVARFTEAYTRRLKRPPPPDAFPVFESVNHLIEAVEAAGLDRDAIRRALGGRWTRVRFSGRPTGNP
jgi:hypothetical protein